jgi:hypothetical protein
MTKNYLLPPLVKTFANHFLFISTQPHMGHPTPTRHIYLTGDSEVGSGDVNQIRAGSSTISHMASLPILIVPSIG